MPSSNNHVNQLSEELLYAVKMDQPTHELERELADLSPSQLTNDLSQDNCRKAFWINIYNAFFLILRKVHQVEKPRIFTKKLITIAGMKWSLDDIEHGVLRRYRFKYSLGYFPLLWPSSQIKTYAVSGIDYRIHFALNCGAVSCPPIAFYKKDQIEEQLEFATLSFLKQETDFKPESKEVDVSRLFFWFLADFGGYSGIREILKEKLHQDSAGYKIKFKAYSWEESLDNFREDLTTSS